MQTLPSLFLLTILKTTESFYDDFLPKEAELIYNYKAVIKAGTEIPTAYESKFELNGQLHVQSVDNTTFFYFTDVNFYTRIGKTNGTNEVSRDNQSDLLKPFGFRKESLITSIEENEHTRNIKRGIISLFYLNKNVYRREKDQSFVVDEKSIYGAQKVYYIINKIEDKLSIEKLFDFDSKENDYCDNDSKKLFSQELIQKFLIENNSMLNQIESNEKIFFTPYQYVSVEQKIIYETTIPVKNRKFDFETHISDLTFNFTDTSNFIKEPVMVDKVLEMVSNIVEYMNKNNLNIEKNQSISNLLKNLAAINDFQLLYEKLSKNTQFLETFHQLLPLIGTNESVFFSIKLITEKIVDDNIALDLLQKIPFYVKVPNKKMLEKFEILAYSKDINWPIRKAAIFTFSNLINEIDKSDRNVLKYIQKNVDNFADLYTKSNNYEEKLVLVQALQNIRLDLSVNYLIDIINSNTTDNNIRYLAISNLKITNFEVIMKNFWPIFANVNSETQIRIAAYHILMKNRPPTYIINNIIELVKNDPNQHLYHYHYKFLKSWSKSTHPCYQNFARKLKQILTLTEKPSYHSVSGFDIIDYWNSDHRYGGGLAVHLIHYDSTTIVKFDSYSQIFNQKTSSYSFYIKIVGIQNIIFKNLHLNINNSKKLFNFNQILNLLPLMVLLNDIHIEISIFNNGQVIDTYFIDNSYLISMDNFLTNSNYKESIKNRTIFYDFYNSLTIPTSIGFPVLIEQLSPIIFDKNIEMITESSRKESKVKFDLLFKLLKESRVGIEFFNPILNIDQGINKLHTYDLIVPVLFDLKLNNEDTSMEINWKLSNNDIGIKSHVSNTVWMDQKSIIVSKGPQYRKNYTIFDGHDKLTGYNYNFTIYDSEYPKMKLSITNIINYFNGKSIQDFLINQWNPLLKPNHLTQGYLLKLSPSEKYPLTQLNFKSKFGLKMETLPNEYLQGMMFDLKIDYETENNQSIIIDHYKIDLNVNYSRGHTLRNFSVEMTKKINDQYGKICLNGSKKWTKDNVLETLTMDYCNPEELLLNATILGIKNPNATVFEVCNPYNHQLSPDYHSIACISSYGSIRKYLLTVRINQSEIMKPIDKMINKDRFEIAVEYPENDDKIDIESEENSFTIDNNFLIPKDNVDYSNLYLILEKIGFVQSCTVNYNSIMQSNEKVPFNFTQQWSNLIENQIFVKLNGDSLLGLKVMQGNHTLEVYPEMDENYQLSIDNNLIRNFTTIIKEDWFNCMKHPYINNIIISTFKQNYYIDFNGSSLHIEVPKVGTPFSGLCFPSDY